MKIICVGRNYAAHIDELENERPKDPVSVYESRIRLYYLKKQPFFIPEFSDNIHHEVEILIKIKEDWKTYRP